MDGKDGDGENGLGEQGEDCGGYKAGDRNSPRDDRNLDPPRDGMDGSGDKADYYYDGDGIGENGDIENDDLEDDDDTDGDDSDSDNELDSAGYEGPCLPNRPKRRFLPSQTQDMALLSMAVPPEDRAAFEDRFRSFKTGTAKPLCPPTGTVYRTRADWIAGAYGCNIALQLNSAADMFPSSSGMGSCFLRNEIYVMDVILNRAPCSEEPALTKAVTKVALKAVTKAAGGDEDDVVLVRSYHEDDLHDDNDYKFRTMILFIVGSETSLAESTMMIVL